MSWRESISGESCKVGEDSRQVRVSGAICGDWGARRGQFKEGTEDHILLGWRNHC